MDEAAKTLLNTLNDAIKLGLGKLPAAAEFAIAEYQRYWMASAILSAVWAALMLLLFVSAVGGAFYAVGVGDKRGKLADAEKDFELRKALSDSIGMAAFVFIACCGAIAITGIAFLIHLSDAGHAMVKYIAPVGSLIANAVK